MTLETDLRECPHLLPMDNEPCVFDWREFDKAASWLRERGWVSVEDVLELIDREWVPFTPGELRRKGCIMDDIRALAKDGDDVKCRWTADKDGNPDADITLRCPECYYAGFYYHDECFHCKGCHSTWHKGGDAHTNRDSNDHGSDVATGAAEEDGADAYSMGRTGKVSANVGCAPSPNQPEWSKPDPGPCPHCGGSGESPMVYPCTPCKGTGNAPEVKTKDDTVYEGTNRLCLRLYGEVSSAYYLGGADARMLHDAADRIDAFREQIREQDVRLEQLDAERDHYRVGLANKTEQIRKMREVVDKRARATAVNGHYEEHDMTLDLLAEFDRIEERE